MKKKIDSAQLTADLIVDHETYRQKNGPVAFELHCECCEQKLNLKTAVWLELDWATNLYHAYPLPAKRSQGCFVFGPTCAKKMVAETERTLSLVQKVFKNSGAKGGSASSQAKKKSSAENGKKGGRPKKSA